MIKIAVDLYEEIVLIELSRMQRETMFEKFLVHLESNIKQKEAKNVN